MSADLSPPGPSHGSGVAAGAGDPPTASTPLPASPLHLGRPRRALEVLRRIYDKAGEDNIFFMAGAISFNVLAGMIPLFLLLVGLGGMVVQARFGDPSRELLNLLLDNLPSIRGDFAPTVETQIERIISGRRQLTLVGGLLLVWFSTRLVGTLRTALREVFDISQDRGIVGGKLFDVKVVLIGGALFLLNLGITAVLASARDLGVDVLGLQGYTLTVLQHAFARIVALMSIWVLFLGVYRYLPARRIPWRTAIIAATFASALHEALKLAFGWYATDVANYRTTYGNLITLAVLFFWIYYEALVFIVAGEFAQVWTMRRALRVKTRGALFGEEAGSS